MAPLDLLPRTSEDVSPELQEKYRKALEEFKEPQDVCFPLLDKQII